ncbi:MAG: glycosyl hydrolase [Candidatus Sumerlaeaceae bacterium]
MLLSCGGAWAGTDLETGFADPPPDAKPWAFWFWMGEYITTQGITLDLEDMAQSGLGGLIMMNIDQGTRPDAAWVTFMPRAKKMRMVECLSPEWWDMWKHAATEADRLGLKISMHNCTGWATAGGPWITPELSKQKLVWTEKVVEGPSEFSGVLQLPHVDRRWNYYKDSMVIAFPLQPSTEPLRATDVKDLGAALQANGQFTWSVPPGKWRLVRFGHTTTGKKNHPTPAGGEGLESDTWDRTAVKAQFEGLSAKMAKECSAFIGKSVLGIESDSYEGDFFGMKQDWTPRMREEFTKRRGYDPLPWMPAYKLDQLTESADMMSRFEYDTSHTVADLFRDNWYGYFGELVRSTGLKFIAEAYYGPFDSVDCASLADFPTAEFWQDGKYIPAARIMASAAHITGRTIVGAESFTAFLSKYQNDPWALKLVGDRALCNGVNRMILHNYVHQPWGKEVKPGMTMDYWGTEFGRNVSWWEPGRAWLRYLARCQFLLQQGSMVADYCQVGGNIADKQYSGYDADVVSEKIIVDLMQPKDGRISLPSGRSYTLLVLPKTDKMLPDVMRKLATLVRGGAAVQVAKKPTGSPSLENYPSCDATVRALAEELWGTEAGNGKKMVSRKVGTGHVFIGGKPEDALAQLGVQKDCDAQLSNVLWTHRTTPEADIYFVSNQSDERRTAGLRFRISGKQPEMWNPVTGEMRVLPASAASGQLTSLSLSFEPRQSVFVLFRRPLNDSHGGRSIGEAQPTEELTGPWQVAFDPKWKGPAQPVSFSVLDDWTSRPENGIKYYGGTAVYTKQFDRPQGTPQNASVFLDLGTVKNMARVALNGQDLGVVWGAPWRVEITKALKPLGNQLEVAVTNTWTNRLIGDDQEPDDCGWTPPRYRRKKITADKPNENHFLGRALFELPEWFENNKPRPSKGRATFATWMFYTKDSRLQPSGLLGPVTLQSVEEFQAP